MFLAGLLNWTDSIEPDNEVLSSKDLKIIAQGFAHIKTIKKSGGLILGKFDLDENNLSQELMLDSNYNPNVIKGYEIVRKATSEDTVNFKVVATWGFNVLNSIANDVLLE